MVSKTIGNWIWGGVQTFFKFIDDTLTSSFSSYPAVKESLSSFVNGILTWFGEISYIKIAMEWVNNTWKWAQSEANPLIKYYNKAKKKIEDLYNEYKAPTLLQSFILFLQKQHAYLRAAGGIQNSILAGVLDAAIQKIQANFGITFGMTSSIRKEISENNKSTFAELLAQKIYLLEQQNVTDSELTSAISGITNELQKTNFKIDSSEIDSVISMAKQKVQNVKNKKETFIAPQKLANIMEASISLQQLLNSLNTNAVDSSNKEKMQQLQSIIDSAKNVRQSLSKNISKNPDGFSFNVGDQGGRLSGGQKQRLCIARAVYKNPPLLILDEATSALDTQSEQIVQDAINNMMQDRTSVVIAHRLSTVQKADRIIVLDKGQIVQEGTHETLMQQEGLYKTLVELQEMN
jgi:ABC-type dipeptide/oligopeptide/nickel transport system ATPase subunit